MEMLGNVLFISKEERTVDEAIANLERFYLNVETSWGNIFDYDMFIKDGHQNHHKHVRKNNHNPTANIHQNLPKQ